MKLNKISHIPDDGDTDGSRNVGFFLPFDKADIQRGIYYFARTSRRFTFASQYKGALSIGIKAAGI
jgi:hypothetical protein